VAADKGFKDRGRSGSGPIPDYVVPGIADPRLATGLAGLAGTIAVLTIGFGTGAAVRRRRSSAAAAAAGATTGRRRSRAAAQAAGATIGHRRSGAAAAAADATSERRMSGIGTELERGA
jgi:cobalt/nickel transport protein